MFESVSRGERAYASEPGPLVNFTREASLLDASGLRLALQGLLILGEPSKVAFPEIDVRPRLSVSTGYGVAELFVHPGSSLVGQTLGESGLWERDITVLTLHRGTQVIPNPRKNVVLEDGSRLLCFGKLDEMRSMIPERRKRQRVRELPKNSIPSED